MKTTTRRGANHALHAFGTAITCGLWAPVWIICAITGRKTVTNTDLEAEQVAQFLQQHRPVIPPQRIPPPPQYPPGYWERPHP